MLEENDASPKVRTAILKYFQLCIILFLNRCVLKSLQTNLLLGGENSDTDSEDDGRYDAVYSDVLNPRSGNRNRRHEISSEGINAVTDGDIGEVIGTTRNPYYGVENNVESPQNIEVVHRTDNPYYLSSNRNRRPYTVNVMSENVDLTREHNDTVQDVQVPTH